LHRSALEPAQPAVCGKLMKVFLILLEIGLRAAAGSAGWQRNVPGKFSQQVIEFNGLRKKRLSAHRQDLPLQRRIAAAGQKDNRDIRRNRVLLQPA